MRFPALCLLTLAAALAASCVSPITIDAVEQRQRRLDSDMAIFYENVADAYFLVGWEYYELAKELEQSTRAAEAEKYFRKAHVFSEFSKELRRNSRKHRIEQGLESSVPGVPTE